MKPSAASALLASLAVLGLAGNAMATPPEPAELSVAGVDVYAEAIGRADELEARGAWADSAAELERAMPAYPQDYTLALRAAWASFKAERFDDARRLYEEALRRAPGAPEASLGLGWSLERLGRCREANGHFKAATSSPTTAASARDGKFRCDEATRWSIAPNASLSGHFYPGHSTKSFAMSGVAGLNITQPEGFVFGAAYRFAAIQTVASSSVSPWQQHEGYVNLGYQGRRFGLTAQYAAIADGSGYFGLSHHVGLAGRWSPFGDITLEAAASFYSDAEIGRMQLAWRLPLGWGFSLTPGIAAQYASSRVLPAGSLAVSLDKGWGSLWLGGKYGAEERPAYLTNFVVQNLAERIRAGLWAGVRVNVGSVTALSFAYALEQLENTTTTPSEFSAAHHVTLGATFTF